MRIRNGVPKRTRALSFSRTMEISSTPRIMIHPQSERVVSGVNCQGKFGINNEGRMNALAAPTIEPMPLIQNRVRIHVGRGESEFLFCEPERR